MIYEAALFSGLILAGLGSLAVLEMVIGVLIFGDKYVQE